jgi:hypothetical protein
MMMKESKKDQCLLKVRSERVPDQTNNNNNNTKTKTKIKGYGEYIANNESDGDPMTL